MICNGKEVRMMDLLEKGLTSLVELVAKGGVRLLLTLIVFAVGAALIRKIVKKMGKSKKLEKMPANMQALTLNGTKVALYVALIVLLAMTLGVEMTAIAAAVASAGLAIGLALQGSLSNLAGGIMLLIFHPFAIGDYISDGTHEGTVQDIGIFYTTLQTWDNCLITIPNGGLANSSVTDYTAKELRRVDLKISTAYSSDTELVKKVLRETLENHEKTLADPAPFVRLGEHGDSALVFYARAWVKKEDYWDVYFDLQEQTKAALDEAGIAIPFPQMDIHLDQVK